MIARFIVKILIFYAMTSCSAQVNSHIYYDLPESVTKHIKDHIDNSKLESSHFAAHLFVNTDRNYVLTIINYNSKGRSDSFKFFADRVIERSNRLIRVGKNEMPIITSEDMVFADIGSTEMSDGRVAKKRVLMTFDGYTIIFDRSGKIYEN